MVNAVRGPELKTSLNLPYLGVSPSLWMFCSAHRDSCTPCHHITICTLPYACTRTLSSPTFHRFLQETLTLSAPFLSLSSTHTSIDTWAVTAPLSEGVVGWIEEKPRVVSVTSQRRIQTCCTLRTVLVGCHFIGQILFEASLWDVSCCFCFFLGDPQEKVQVPWVYCHWWTVSGSDTHGGKVSQSFFILLKSLYLTKHFDLHVVRCW